MEPFKKITSPTVVLPSTNIDTDQIIPARFLKVIDKHGLGKWLFADWRYGPGGEERPEFVLNQPAGKAAKVLVAGHNFGCGSSREHAPWALVDFGFRAVVSSGIADIFRNNATKNGLLPVIVGEEVHQALLKKPGATVSVDLEEQVLTLPDGRVERFSIDPFARQCLLSGVDELGFLLNRADAISAFEGRQA